MTPWYLVEAPKPDEHYRALAQARTDNLTKPNGSLGVLETVATTLAALQRTESPKLDQLVIRIFAADHGIAEEGVSAFAQAVTAEMVRNFSNAGAAICVLAKQLEADFEVINVGTATALEPLANVVDRRVADGTRNFRYGPAMTASQLEAALAAGKQTIDACGAVDCFIGGEMGIANTTSAAAMACALLDTPAALLVGRGTGVSDEGIKHKTQVVEQSLALHRPYLTDPLAVLQRLGGYEIAALCGAYLRAAQQAIPILVDGFISTVAVLAAVRLNPSIQPWLLFSHQSDECGHSRVLEVLDAQPLLKLNMRLGEASGGATAIPVLKMACALHNGMASFDVANISRD